MSGIPRRALLRGAAGAGATVAAGALPAWARTPTSSASSLRRPGSLPFPHLPAGHESMPQIRHVVVLIMENHSFDNLLGMVPHEVRGRGAVDGLGRHRGRPVDFNRDRNGHRVFAAPASSPCQLHGEPSQSWNASHESFDAGRNDGFVRASGPIAMRYWDRRDLPFTYSLVEHFPIGQRFFCSTLAQNLPQPAVLLHRHRLRDDRHRRHHVQRCRSSPSWIPSSPPRPRRTRRTSRSVSATWPRWSGP